MEQKKIGNVTVNDGKGLLDNDGLIDLIIVRCNNAVKELTNGQYLNFCTEISNIGQMLVSLKKGVKNDREALEEQIEELKQLIDRLNSQG